MQNDKMAMYYPSVSTIFLTEAFNFEQCTSTISDIRLIPTPTGPSYSSLYERVYLKADPTFTIDDEGFYLISVHDETHTRSKFLYLGWYKISPMVNHASFCYAYCVTATRLSINWKTQTRLRPGSLNDVLRKNFDVSHAFKKDGTGRKRKFLLGTRA